MTELTLRRIPDEVMVRLRTLAAVERRSVNSEILVVLEKGLERETSEALERARPLNRSLQARLWGEMCGRWEDDRSWRAIAADIASHRTSGREVTL